jgi:hypothetical protein
VQRRAWRCGDLGCSSCGDGPLCCRSNGQRAWTIAALCMNVPRFKAFNENSHLHTHSLCANAAARQCSMHCVMSPACTSK